MQRIYLKNLTKWRLTAALCLGVGLLAPGTAAAVPDMIGYSGHLTDASGSVLTAAYDFEFRIFGAAVGGTALYLESIDDVPVSAGHFSVVLSTNEIAAGATLSSLTYLHAKLYLEINVDGETLAPRQGFTPVPWATQSGVHWEEVQGVPTNLSSFASLSCPLGQVPESAGEGMWSCASLGDGTIAGEDIVSGTVPFARLPTGTGATHVARGNHTHPIRVRRVTTNSTTATAVCADLPDTPKVATGGGCYINPGGTMRSSYPINSGYTMATDTAEPAGWHCSCSGSCTTVTAFAICIGP